MALVLVAASSHPARAESTDPDPDLVCSFGIAPDNDAHVPANVPALVIYDRGEGQPEDPSLWPDLAFGSLRASSGGSFIELDRRRDALSEALLLSPKTAPIVGETYVLDIEKRCPNATRPVDRGPMAIHSSVVIDPPSAFPKLIGTARMLRPNDNGDGEIEITLSPELSAFRAVTRMAIELNREPWTISRSYGAIPFEAGIARYRIPRSACKTLDGAVRPVHVLFQAHVAGVADDPEPLGVDADVRCDTQTPLPTAQPFPQPSATPVDGACGCRAAGTSRSRDGAALVAMAFALVALRRRRST